MLIFLWGKLESYFLSLVLATLEKNKCLLSRRALWGWHGSCDTHPLTVGVGGGSEAVWLGLVMGQAEGQFLRDLVFTGQLGEG